MASFFKKTEKTEKNLFINGDSYHNFKFDGTYSFKMLKKLKYFSNDHVLKVDKHIDKKSLKEYGINKKYWSIHEHE